MPESNEVMSIEGQLVGMPLAGPESFSQQQLAYLRRVLGVVDETVLYENTNGEELQNGITLSESRLNFESIKITYCITTNAGPTVIEIPMLGINRGSRFIQTLMGAYDNHEPTTAGYCLYWQVFFTNCTDTYLHSQSSQFIGKVGFINASTPGTWTQGANNAVPVVYKVVGVHRISGGN